MLEEADPEARTNGIGIGLFLSLCSSSGTGYWAYTLDPQGTGGSILIIPAIVVVAVVSFAFLATGIITRNETYGWSLVLGGIATPVLFIVAINIFRFLFGS